tara:strand:- start:619 stop:906 length:288 start_codon:yes stop_codon:yes gene_type:complete
MSKNIIQSIVIILAILIVFAFLALIYGMYLKISKPTDILIKNPDFFSSNLSKDEKIMNIEVIDKGHILILINKDNNVKGAIYNIKKNKIIRIIDK